VADDRFERHATYHNGGYSDSYAVHHRKQVIVEEQSKPRAVKPPPKPRTKSQSRQRRVKEIENEIAICENQPAELTNQLAKPAADWRPAECPGIGRRQNELQSQLESLYSEWETATVPAN
jgi:hypothetical protein